jgi:hypothetical protein
LNGEPRRNEEVSVDSNEGEKTNEGESVGSSEAPTRNEEVSVDSNEEERKTNEGESVGSNGERKRTAGE